MSIKLILINIMHNYSAYKEISNLLKVRLNKSYKNEKAKIELAKNK